jgi:hypothetical protein
MVALTLITDAYLLCGTVCLINATAMEIHAWQSRIHLKGTTFGEIDSIIPCVIHRPTGIDDKISHPIKIHIDVLQQWGISYVEDVVSLFEWAFGSAGTADFLGNDHLVEGVEYLDLLSFDGEMNTVVVKEIFVLFERGF